MRFLLLKVFFCVFFFVSLCFFHVESVDTFVRCCILLFSFRIYLVLFVMLCFSYLLLVRRYENAGCLKRKIMVMCICFFYLLFLLFVGNPDSGV